MTEDELRRALDGLFAYDMGSPGTGIHDEGLRDRVTAELAFHRQFPTWRAYLARLTREMWLSEEAIEQGYGCEDALHFLEWLEERMDTPVPG